MEFKDVVHFYQGCKFIIKEPDGSDFIDTLNIVSVYEDGHIEVWGSECECIPLEDIKLILRNADYSEMTEDENEKYKSLCKHIVYADSTTNGLKDSTVDTPESLAWLIINKFDVFDLRDKGYAIYDNTVQDAKKTLTEIKSIQSERQKQPYEFQKPKN